jgi:hypothetical protein
MRNREPAGLQLDPPRGDDIRHHIKVDVAEPVAAFHRRMVASQSRRLN